MLVVLQTKTISSLSCKVGVTCENFETVCGMAGVTPSKARSFAYKVIKADNKKFLRNRIRSVLRGDNEKENDV